MSKAKKTAYSILAERRFNERVRVDSLQDKLLHDKEYYALHCERVDLRAKMLGMGSQSENISIARARYEEIVALMENRMEALGIDKEDLKIKYHCPLCKDTGFVDGQECNCLKQLIYSALRENCGSLATEESSFEKVDFSRFPSSHQDDYKMFYGILNKMSEKFPHNNTKVFGIFGPVGVGKTYGISILANNLMQKGFSVLYLNSAEMNSLFLKYHLAKEQEKAELWTPLIECDLLILDDLGAEPNITNVTANYLLCLLNEREDSTTCYTSNLTPDQMREKYGDRVFSRISHKTKSATLILKGRDLRIN